MIPPSRPNVTRLSDESVMVRWLVTSDEGLPIQFFKVQYRMIGNANNSISRGQWMTSSEDIPPHVRSYEVKELKPDHFYRFRIAAVYSNNDNKFGAISVKYHLQRASQLSPAKSHLVVPILQRVEGVSETEIRCVWSLPNHVGTSVEGFYAYFRPASTAGEYSKATIDGMDTREFTLNHLEAGTLYEFKLQSFTASAASDFSAILTGKTLGACCLSGSLAESREDDEVIIIIISLCDSRYSSSGPARTGGIDSGGGHKATCAAELHRDRGGVCVGRYRDAHRRLLRVQEVSADEGGRHGE